MNSLAKDKQKKIKAVIFDMDGVLIEARDWHFEALNKALGLFGHSINRHEHLTTYNGLPTKKKLEILSTVTDLPKALHPFIIDLKQLYTMEFVALRCKPTFHHEFLLSRLKNEGYKLGVASNSIRYTVDRMLRQANIFDYMDVVLSNDDVVRTKPDPEIYIKAMKTLGVQPRECLVVEDNENGIQAAKQCGAHVMVVDGPEDVTYANVQRFISDAQRSFSVVA